MRASSCAQSPSTSLTCSVGVRSFTGISTSALVTPRSASSCCETRMRTPTQVLEAETFEESKGRVRGLHFLSVQNGPEAEQPDGCWLLRDTEAANKAKR